MAKTSETAAVEFQFSTNNNDTGSLKVPGVALEVGDEIVIEGEARPRTITYIMGRNGTQHACCKGTGPMPTGMVRFNVIKK